MDLHRVAVGKIRGESVAVSRPAGLHRRRMEEKQASGFVDQANRMKTVLHVVLAAIAIAGHAFAAEKKICVGLYGSNGHQLNVARFNYPDAQLVAVATLKATTLPEGV